MQRRASRDAAVGWYAVLALALVAVVGAVLAQGSPGEPATVLTSNFVPMLLAAAAAVSSALAARRSTGRLRISWISFAVGSTGWTVGQIMWSVQEVFLEEPPVFPSVAELGFLVFPLATAIGLWHFPSHTTPGARLRGLFDGVVVIGSLLAISWTTVLGSVAAGVHPSGLAALLAMAYPIADFSLIAIAIFMLSRPGPYRRTLVLLTVAMVSQAAADSAWAYGTVNDSWISGGMITLGWVIAFVLIAIAAVTGAGASADRDVEMPATAVTTPVGPAMLPFVPLTLGAVICAIQHFNGVRATSVEIAGLAVAVIALLCRQYLMLLDQRRLVDTLGAREEQLRLQAFMDQLTGLANRALFQDRLAHALELHRRDMRPLALLFCDLDDFKAVNDIFGHAAGDQLLIRASDRLRGALRSGDTLARFGGDEFAVLLEDGGEAARVAVRIIEALRPPFTINNSQVSVGVSVGLVDLGQGDDSPSLESLLARADIAMYSAKRAGKGRMALYEPSMMLPEILDLRLRLPLAEAIGDHRINAVYQPIVSLDDGRVIALEALARWRHEDEDIPPADFIPLAQRAGLIGALTDVMLNQACADLASWSRTLGHRDLMVAVNVPPGLITDIGFADRVAAVVNRYDVAGQLVLEITEDALLADLSTARIVTRRLSKLGVPLSLDDFGTGHSLLLHLQQIPLNSLKVDIGFIANIDRDAKSERFLGALLKLGRELGLDVIAEGVERITQEGILRRLGCPAAQGRLYSAPVPPHEVPSIIQERHQVTTG